MTRDQKALHRAPAGRGDRGAPPVRGGRPSLPVPQQPSGPLRPSRELTTRLQCGHELPGHPVEHRQRRARTRCGASSLTPTSSSSGCGCTAPTRSGGTPASSCGLEPVGRAATNDVDALLALDADVRLLHGDRRPAARGGGRRHVPHPRSRARTWCRRRSCRSSTRRTADAGDGRASSRPRARRAASSCFTSGIDPGFANDLLPLVLTGFMRARRRRSASWRSSTTPPTTQPEVLFDTMGFGQAARRTRRSCCSPACSAFAWGGVVHMIAAGLGVEVDEIREVHERRARARRLRHRASARRGGHDGRAALRGAGHRGRRARASSSSTSPGCTTTSRPTGRSPRRTAATASTVDGLAVATRSSSR